MKTFAFAVTVAGLDLDDADLLERLHSAEFVLVPSETDGVVTLDVEIDAETGEDALQGFLDHLAAAPEVSVRHVGADLVNATEVGKRLDVSREAVRTWATGIRGPADFPDHWCVLAGGQKLWTWASVHDWAAVNDRLPGDLPCPLDAACVDWFNGTLVPPSARGKKRSVSAAR